jgi:hypothetical protein
VDSDEIVPLHGKQPKGKGRGETRSGRRGSRDIIEIEVNGDEGGEGISERERAEKLDDDEKRERMDREVKTELEDQLRGGEMRGWMRGVKS